MGGMAELFLAFTAGPGGFRKFVALKQILPDIKKDESFVKMFLDEARHFYQLEQLWADAEQRSWEVAGVL